MYFEAVFLESIFLGFFGLQKVQLSQHKCFILKWNRIYEGTSKFIKSGRFHF